MKVRCICKNMMNDNDVETCEVFAYYDANKYDAFLETNPQTVSDFVDGMPLDGVMWKCKNCNRIHFFKKGKIEVYLFEKDIND